MKLIDQPPMVLHVSGTTPIPLTEIRNGKLKGLYQLGSEVPVAGESAFYIYSKEQPEVEPGTVMALDFPGAGKRWMVEFNRVHPVGSEFETRVIFLNEADLVPTLVTPIAPVRATG